MRASLFQIVTFATDLFRGNPAFVLTDTAGASDKVLSGICSLLGADVIAAIDNLSAIEPSLRFFTTEGAHSGAGHATLAAAHMVLRSGRPNSPRSDAGQPDAVCFRLENGERRVARAVNGRIAIGYPTMPATRVDRVVEMAAALGVRPAETWVSAFGYVAVFEDAAAVAALRPDMTRVSAFDRTAMIATAPGGASYDVAIRVFAPNAGLPEDPVCGTAHRIIIPYWAKRLGRTKLHSRHLSPRGGDLWCEIDGGQVIVAGESSLVIEGTIRLPNG